MVLFSLSLQTLIVAAFATGLGPTCYRNCVWNAVYFGTMHTIKKHLPTTTKGIVRLVHNLSKLAFE